MGKKRRSRKGAKTKTSSPMPRKLPGNNRMVKACLCGIFFDKSRPKGLREVAKNQLKGFGVYV